jgi:hypothetical protein
MDLLNDAQEKIREFDELVGAMVTCGDYGSAFAAATVSSQILGGTFVKLMETCARVGEGENEVFEFDPSQVHALSYFASRLDEVVEYGVELRKTIKTVLNDMVEKKIEGILGKED